MDKSSLKLECLKLAVARSSHLGPQEVVGLASIYERYCLDLAQESEKISVDGNSKEPSDNVKEHNTNSKKQTPK
jgi:hypothetical protein